MKEITILEGGKASRGNVAYGLLLVFLVDSPVLDAGGFVIPASDVAGLPDGVIENGLVEQEVIDGIGTGTHGFTTASWLDRDGRDQAALLAAIALDYPAHKAAFLSSYQVRLSNFGAQGSVT